MAVRDTVDDGHFDCFEKHDVSSEHRDESKFTEFPEHRDESKIRKVIANIETDQNARKVIANIDTGQNSEKWSRRSRWMNRTEIEDKNQDMSVFVQKELTDQKLQQEILKKIVMNLMDQNFGARKTARIRDELSDGSKIGAGEHERIHGKVSDRSRVETR